jgi:hypothetical protein
MNCSRWLSVFDVHLEVTKQKLQAAAVKFTAEFRRVQFLSKSRDSPADKIVQKLQRELQTRSLFMCNGFVK